MDKLISRKGQLGGLTPAILALVFAAIILVFGIIITDATKDTQVARNEVVSVVNETGGFINETGYQLGTINTKCGLNSIGVTQAINATFIIGSGNYTVSSIGVVTNATAQRSTAVNFTYSYRWGGTACTQTNKTVVGLASFADFWQIIVLAIVITIVIGLLIGVFGGKKSR